jgi:hypothetical protein
VARRTPRSLGSGGRKSSGGYGGSGTGNSAAGVGDADLAGGGRWGGGSRAGPEGKARSWDGLPWGDASRSRSSGSRVGQVRSVPAPVLMPCSVSLSVCLRFSFFQSLLACWWWCVVRIGPCRTVGSWVLPNFAV